MTDSTVRLSRPAAGTMEVADLVELARSGKFELPDFQRPMEWKQEDRLKLIDSIYRGFPIGDILFWEPEQPRSGAVRFGPFSPLTRKRDPWLIVDGQQRLATLFGCLLIPDTDEANWRRRDWRFAFHVDKKSIVELPQDPPPEYLPLAIAIDTSKYLKWTRILPDLRREERLEVADDFCKALRTYRIPFYVVKTNDQELLQRVFERVNNTGKPLKMSTVFDALFPEDHGFKLGEVSLGLENLGFGVLKSELLLQGIKAMVGMDPALKFSSGLRVADQLDEEAGKPGATRQTLQDMKPRLHRAATRAIEALLGAGIPRIEVLPFAIIVPQLIQFFDRFQEPIPIEVEEKLRHLIWLVAVGGSLQKHRSTYLRATTRTIRVAESAAAAVAKLVDDTRGRLDRPSGMALQAHHDWRSGPTRLVSLALFGLAPQNLRTGERIPVWELVSAEGHELFRQVWPKVNGSLKSSSANRLISMPDEPPPAQVLADLAQSDLDTETICRLESHAIDREAIEALRSGNREMFLDIRAKRLGEVVDEFLAQRLPKEAFGKREETAEP